MPYQFETKDQSSKDPKEPVMSMILKTAMKKERDGKEMEDARFFLSCLLDKIFDDDALCENRFLFNIAQLRKCQTCKSVDGSVVEGTIVDVNVWATDRDDIIDVCSLISVTLYFDIDMLDKENCFNRENSSTRLNARSFIQTSKVLPIPTNRSHNELAGRLTKTQISISEILDIGMSLAGFYENEDSLSNFVLTGTVQYQGCSIINGNYVVYIFSDSGSTVTLINYNTIESYDFTSFSSSALFKDFQCNSHMLFYIIMDCNNNTNPFQKYFSDLPFSKHELLESYLFSKKSIENGLSFTDVSSCISYTSWLNDNTMVYFLAYLQVSSIQTKPRITLPYLTLILTFP